VTVALTEDETRTAWETGLLGYRLRNGQKKVRQVWLAARTIAQKFYIECTRRFGKSSFGLFLLSEFCIQKPGSRAGFYAPVKEGLRDYIVPLIEKVFADCPEDLKPTLDSTLTLTFPNGSTIIFRGSNNQQHRLRRGVDLDIAFIDEARDVDDLDNLVDSVIMPALFNSGGPLLISSTPADTEDHPLHEIMQGLEKLGAMIRFTIWDANRYDPEDFPLAKIEAWKKETQDDVAWQREYEAKWVKDPTKIAVPEWDKQFSALADVRIAVLREEPTFQFWHKYAGLDSGVQDKTAGLLGFYCYSDARLYIEDEFALQGSEVRTDRISDEFKNRERDLCYQAHHDRSKQEYGQQLQHQRMFRRVSDNNNLILINDLNSVYGLDFVPTSKDELAAMINKTREWVKNGRIWVHPRCKELLGCLANAIWDKKREKLAKSKVYGHFDALMALVYLVRNVDVATDPIPKHFGKSWATHAGVPVDAHVPHSGAERMASIFNVKTTRENARSSFARTGGSDQL
jgi:frataxin-like iron-binding protein CyaY